MSVWGHMATHSNMNSWVLPIYTDALMSIALRITSCEYGDTYAITISKSPQWNFAQLGVVIPAKYSCSCLVRRRADQSELYGVLQQQLVQTSSWWRLQVAGRGKGTPLLSSATAGFWGFGGAEHSGQHYLTSLPLSCSIPWFCSSSTCHSSYINIFNAFTARCQSRVLYPVPFHCSVTSLTAYTVDHGHWFLRLSRNKESYSWPMGLTEMIMQSRKEQPSCCQFFRALELALYSSFRRRFFCMC